MRGRHHGPRGIATEGDDGRAIRLGGERACHQTGVHPNIPPMTKLEGPGRRPIPADLYLRRWSPVVESLRAGDSTRAIKEKHGTCAETVRHVRRFMMAEGWTPPPRPVRPKSVRPAPEPKAPRFRMTAEDRLKKHSGVAFWLRAGKTMKQVAELAEVSVNTVRVVRRALVARGEVL